MSSVATLTELTPAQRRELLDMARDRGLVRDRSGLLPIQRTARNRRLPLSFAQERLWFIDRLEPGSAVYNISVAMRLGGALDEPALERALGAIVRRHEALRTTFAEVDGSPVQVIAPFGGFAVPVQDLSGLSEADREAAVGRLAREEALLPFDLSAGPLFRAGLLRLGDKDHVLLLSMHHIVSDGWSMGVLYRELSALYGAFREGRESPLPEPAVQYADYAVWQREQLAGEVLERQLSYWRDRLAGAPELLELPTDHPRMAVQTYRGAKVSAVFSPELLERLQALGRSEGATLYMTLLGAFQVLLGKYSGSRDIVVGSPIAGRMRKEIEETIGFFVNTVVLRTDLSGDPSFREVLRRTREVTLGADEHQGVPFERLVAELQPERSLSHTPLFQVMFALQNAVGGGGALPGLSVSEVAAELDSAKFDLSLMFKATAGGLRVGLNYSTDLFKRSTADRILRHLQRVLEEVAADADVRLSQLDLLAAEEREQVLQAWNQTERSYADPPVHALFAEWARRAPETVALLDGREAVTYAALDRRASLLARQLRDLGVGPETPVGLCMERTPELLVGVLGIWKAGGAYVPLDPSYPAERLRWIITDAALPVVVATGGTAAVLPEHGATLVRVDQLADAASETASDAAPELAASAASLAYVIYTSGSTGRPKGVLVQHGSLSNLLAATREAFGVVAGDVMPALASYAFDIWLFEALLPLTSGAAVRLEDRDRVLDVPALLEEIADATLVHAVPALMRQVVQAERETPRLHRLRRAFVGGDRVPADLLAGMRETLSGAETHVLYGPTEGTILASAHPVPDGIAYGHPIGHPLGNVRLYVCDGFGSPQPAGVPGELLIGGAGVARGYLGRPELTAEHFVPDPFGGEPGARLYRTGDRVRRRGDGTLEFMGRLDGQVKIRGFRIEPGEVEAVLRQHDRVAECVVVVREDEPGERRLAAYVVPAPGTDVELWPSIGEYFVYDELIYHGLTHDTLRNERYLRALRRHAPGKAVLDVGTGADAILARLAVEAGARHVYAVELLEKSYLAARDRVRELGLEDRITVMHGDARTVELPEPAEVCVSEIVEAIAGGEGAAVILNHARRLLAPGAVMIPASARTRVAAVTLPDELRHAPAFSPTAAHYVKRIFEEVGHPFDLRLCIRNFPADHVLSTVGTYEALDFAAGPVHAEYTRGEELVVERAGRMDGLLLWLRMELAEGEELDIMEEETAWFPVYFPLFEPGIEVAAGDRLRLECRAEIPDGVAPDYGARGALVRPDGEEVPFEFVSCHHRQGFRASPFYRRLFADAEVPCLDGQGEMLPALLREHVRRALPEYMVPSAFILLEQLPLTPNGKPDRKALPAPEQTSGEARFAAARTPVEEVLAEIWAEVLRRERVGVHDSFFALGGHSLLATRVVSRVRQLFGVELPMRALFEGPTVAELAGRVEALRRAGLPALPPVVPAGRTGALQLSFAQERLWFIDRLEPGSAVYNMPVARRLGGVLDTAVLERALGEIVRRHEALRTVFAEVDGSPVQVIVPFGGFALPVEDLSGLGVADREAALRDHARDEAARPFDLSAGPLFRAALLRLGEQDHVLLLSMHHIVSDGWSMGVFFRELAALYEAYREGRETPLAELGVQYADYAAWQREHLRGEVLDRQLTYWREQLARAPELLELPADHPRPAVQTFRGAREPIELSGELLERLRALGRSEGATLYMVVLSAFQALLARYSGSEDVVVGSPVAGRGPCEVQELIGFFVNTLVLRTNLSGDPTFRQLLGRVREATLGAYEHQEMPFERLVAELRPERSLSHSPLFQVAFTLNNAQDAGGGLAGLSVQGVGTGLELAKFDLSLGLAVGSDSLRGELTYSTDLWEAATMRRLVGHFTRLVEQAATDPDVRISRLTLLNQGERRQVVEEWNRTDAEYPSGFPIHRLFEEQAGRTPDATAVSSAGATLTYATVDHAANRLANHLRRRGVRSETRVGICLERGTDLVVAILAVLKAGGAYVPLDPAYPAERLAFMLADSGAPLLLTRLPLPQGLPPHAAEVVCLDTERERIAAESAQAPDAGVLPGNLAYVIYTSGSTGRPKGVLVQHGSLANLLAATREAFGVGAGDLMPALASYAFDIWLFEALLPLTSGAAVRLVDRDRVLDVPALLEEVADVTLLHAVPALMRQMVQAERASPRLGRLRRAFVGGDRVPADLLAEMRETLSGAETHVLYGPTEGTILASTQPVPQDGRVEGHPIGRPLGNVRLYVCDALVTPQPAGVPGELLIGGAGVTRGYLGRAGLTAEQFVPDPFGGEAGARLYRTGDRARWRADGTLEFLGRVDQQVKIRGFRIEPGEIEAVLSAHRAVREARVIVREDAPGEHRLVAYVVGGVEAEELRGHLRKSLPEYMVPSAFVLLEQLPLTPNGKLDRKALPAPEYAGDRERHVVPRTPVEEVLAGIWGEVLGRERVGVHDSFFDLGGHSLLATRVVSRVRELFGVELPLRALFEGPTVAELAGRVEEMRRAELPVLPPVVPTERTGALPLSFAQERLWFIDRLDPGSTVYNMPMAWRLEGALDQAALERSLGEIVRRHDALRTTFAEADGYPVQVVAPFHGFALPVEDLSGLGEADREAAVRGRAGEEALRPFDLAAGPLFRAALLRVGEQDHVLLLSMHHIVSDGWSMGVLFRELSSLYAAYREGRESPLPELAVQYADYAAWQRRQLEGEALDRQLAYWRERLAGAPELLELPTDHPRPAVQSFQGAHERIELSLELLERLRGLGRSEGATLYMVLLGAFQVVLSKYGGSDDVVVGSPIAGRTSKEVEELIGFFVNTLVLRTDLSGDPSFRAVLGRVREVTLGAYEHQEVPFERLVAELQPERSLSHSPLFQVMFALQNAEGGGGALPGLEVSGVDAELASAKFDLTLGFAAHPEGLRGGLTYSTDLFERGTIVRVLSHLERVLEQVAADADVRLSRLDLLGEAERARLLAVGEGAAPEFPRATVDALFAQAAAAAPEAVALAWDGGRMTYAELDGRANRLAHHLRRAGVAAGTRVGVCLERGPEMVVATLAALKAGGAYVPLDPAYPAERLAFMLADTAAPVLVTESALADRLPAHDARVIRVDGDAAAIAAESADAAVAGRDPEAAAYVMYTSGSTGRPKGVEVPHRAIVRLVRGQDYVSIDPSDVFLQLAPASFDPATLELWGPLLNGARLAIHPAGQPTVESIGGALAEHGVTVLWLTAGLFHLVVEEGIDILRGVRQLLAGGDVLSVHHVRRVLRELPETALINGYGPTENTTFTCCHRIDALPEEGASIPVGRPIANTYVRVLDAGMRPVPVGVPGELYAGGAGLALGYLNRPELTAEKFAADPYLPGARLYRTGDRVRWRESAEVRECVSAGVDPSPVHSRTAVLEFLGRVDTQVKIRGFRVEPGEVEAVLRAWPGVREAAVVVREEPGEKRLVAYVGGEVEAEEVRGHLRKSLPEYMLPSAFVFLDALPLTPNGKLDRKALPAPEYAACADRYLAPRMPVEEVLAGIWGEVLGRERVGVHDSFFELGGHSLLATRVVSRVRELFGVELPLRALFEGPTVEALAGRVEEMRRAELPVLPPVVATERTGALPLSFAQERLWFIDRLDPGSTVYNMPMAWRLEGALDQAALERSLGEIVRRHDALRTTFAEADGSPVQVVAPFRGFALPVEDLSGLGEADREAAVRGRAGEEALRPFDLAAGPLFRAALLRVGGEDHVLLLSMHHIVSDGWSMGVLFRELSALYAAYREGRESPLPELAVQYADYAAWQRRQLEREALDRQISYWRERLAGAPELLELPTDHPRPAVQSFQGAHERIELSLELLERLRRLGRSEGATLYMVLLGAFQVLLSKYSGGEDIVVGSPIAGRTRREVEELIGFFVNTLVLRTDLSGDPSFREVLGRVREATLGAYEHQEVPFERLVAELQPERSLSHSPLFQVMFALQNAEGGGGALAGLEVSGVNAELASAKFDLTLGFAAHPEGLRGGLTYSTDLFERGTIVRVLSHLERVLEQVAADADVRLSRLELLGEAERALVLDAWNRTERPYPRGVCIHELFEAQARERPDAVALVWDGAELTYQELAARANRLAHHLVRRGVGPESRVGVLLERGVELIVAVLAVVKAGGCYVPLDPAYPAERLRLMLDDSSVRVLLSRSGLAGVVETGGLDVVHLDRAADAIASEPTEAPRSGATAENLAYIVYTSGSTGRPKGIMVGHRQVVQLVVETDYVQLRPGDHVAQASNAGFDALTFELWGAFLNGATLVGIPQDVLLSPPALREMLREQRITTIFLTTALVNQLSHEQPDIFSSLREVLFGGQAVDADSVRRLLKAGGPERLLHMYGPTETTTFCLYEQVEHVADDALSVPLGHATGNQRIYLLDGALNPVPRGVAGEAYVGGGGVSRGYLDRPGLTAERFIPDPFSAEPGARMYRTGDRMRWRAERKLEFVGRVDDQVKIRGFRIEPAEVEAVLSAHEAVREARVIVREDAPGETRLVAYVVGGAEAEEVRAYLRERLPEYMLPAAFVFLDALPLTPNGKLDRRALPAPDPAPAATSYVAPRRPLEAALAGIWAEVLGLERVGVKENFFDLGGHSLLLVKVQARLYETLDRKIPIVDLFRFPTVAALAEHLGAGVEVAGGPQAGAEGRRRRGRDRAAVRRALAGQGAGPSGGATHKGDDT